MNRILVAAALGLLALSASAAAVSYGASMEGASEIPPGDHDGLGYADLVLDGTTLRYAMVVFNIATPTSAHIHRGKRGETSGPLITFPTPFTRHAGCPSPGAPACAERFVTQGAIDIGADNARILQERPADFYLNVPNDAFPSGAVRGQVQHARFLPIVGQTPGAAGTRWFTRFAVLNRSMVDATEWVLEFLPQSPLGNTDRYASGQTAIAPASVSVSSEFPVPTYTGIGSMRILADEPFEAVGSIYNGAGGARGDFGYSVNGKTLEEAKTSGLLVDLTTSSTADIGAGVGHRSNIGFFNPYPVTVDATFRAYGRTGALLGEKTIAIPPGSMLQQPAFDLIDSVPAGDRVQDSAWVTWFSSSPLFVYATVTNNRTGDSEIRD